jgi:hypothetical protein
MSVALFLRVELVAAALLALWVAARFPGLGPKSLRSAALFAGLSLGVLQCMCYAVVLVAGLPYGAYLAFFLCILPSFFAAFLAAAWLIRLFAGALGGSGGGGGHRVPAPSRR